MTTTEYTFRNQQVQMHALQHYLDPITSAELADIGIGLSARCLEVGAGGGSVAAFLSGLVGPHGRVIAIDTDPTLLNPAANLGVYQHDIRTDHPLPESGPFDLVHARLVTQHLAERREVLHRLAGLLAPGGWLLLGEFVNPPPRVIHASTDTDADLFHHVIAALVGVLTDAGVDLRWGEQLPGVLRAEGLTDIRTHWYAQTWSGGGSGCQLLVNNVSQKRDQLLATGVTAAQLDAFVALLNDPALVVRSYEFACARGRRPTQ